MALREKPSQFLYIFSKVKGVSSAHLAQGFRNGSLQCPFPPKATRSLPTPSAASLLQHQGLPSSPGWRLLGDIAQAETLQRSPSLDVPLE